MKTLVEELEVIPVSTNDIKDTLQEPNYVLRAQAAGFINVRLNSRPPIGITNLPYPEIIDEAINKLLIKRAKEVFEEKIKDQIANRGSKGVSLYLYSTNVEWKETPIEEYQGFPPARIITSLEKARATGVFEKFIVATVEGVYDPLLVGIKSKDEKKERRALIDWWEHDFTPDEINSLVE